MIALLLSMAIAAGSPLQARLVDVDLERTRSAEPHWYNRVSVEIASAEAREIRLCPEDATVVTARRYGSEMRIVDRFAAHAMLLGQGQVQAGGCRDLALGADRPQTVTFLVAGVPGRWRREDRYTFELEADGTRFRFVEEALSRR